MKPKATLRLFLALAGSSMLAISSASAADYTWGGGDLLWNNTSALGWNGGPPLTTDTATINSGTVTFAATDTYGNAANTSSAAITVNTGGTLASGGRFNSLWNLTLGGGTLLSNGGVNTSFGTFNLAGTVTAAANVTSSISTGTGSNNIINLGNGNTTAVTNTTFNVGAAGTLNVGTVLQDHRYFTGSVRTSVAGLIKTGDGVMNLNATNTYTGATRIDAGTLTLGHATNTLSDVGAVNVNGGTLALGTNTDTVGAVTLSSGSITGSGAGMLTGTGSAFDVRSGTISAKLGGTVGLTKTTAGTVTISSDNSSGGYTGATNVNDGTLIVNGSLANTSTTIGAGTPNSGTLQGSGSIGGSVTIQSGGTLSPGNSIESLGTGAVSFLTGSTYAYELQTNLYGTTPGLAGDLTGSTGTLDIQAGSILTLTDLAASTALAADSKLTLISYFGGWTGTELFTYNATTLNDGDTITLGLNQWRFDYDDTSGGFNYTGDQTGATSFVTMTVIPEPRAALLGGLGLMVLLRRRR